MSARDGIEGLDVIEGEARALKIGGELIDLRPLTVGQLPAFARAVRPIVSSLGGADITPETIIELLADHGDSIIDAVHVATRIPADRIRQLGLDEMLTVVSEVISVNRDFLTGRLPAAMQAAASRIVPATPSPGAGPTPSRP